MKTINYNIINAWNNFNINDYSLMLIFNFAKNLGYNFVYTPNKKDPEIIFSSVFKDVNNIFNYNSKVKILYTLENLNNWLNFKNNIDKFDFIIGYVKDSENSLNLPSWFFELYNTDKSKLNNVDINKNKNLCLISRNPHDLRLRLLKDFTKKNYKVDCPSFVGKNMNIIVRDKINFIKDYYFNICPENSYEEAYTTEKLFDCCIAGCIPIYYGCENLNNGFYNKNRIIHINKDLSNYDQMIDKTMYLLKNKSELLEFISQKPFALNIEEHFYNVEQKSIKFLNKIISKL